MQLMKRDFREYFHQFLILEADTLTERLKGSVSVEESDCFMAATSAIDQNGELCFGILSVGRGWKNCRKGLYNHRILAEFRPQELRLLESRIFTPDHAMRQKAGSWIEEKEEETPVLLKKTREERRLDHLRDDFCPDIVPVGIVEEAGIREYPMHIVSFEGPFLCGRLLQRSDDGKQHIGELVRALPYPTDSGCRLLMVFAGDVLSAEDEKARRNLIEEGERIGYGFAGPCE